MYNRYNAPDGFYLVWSCGPMGFVSAYRPSGDLIWTMPGTFRVPITPLIVAAELEDFRLVHG